MYNYIRSIKIALFKDLDRNIIEAKVAEIFFLPLFRTFSIISRIKSLSKVILDNSDRPNRIVQVNVLHITVTVTDFFLIVPRPFPHRSGLKSQIQINVTITVTFTITINVTIIVTVTVTFNKLFKVTKGYCVIVTLKVIFKGIY